jgi:acyl dehydratase
MANQKHHYTTGYSFNKSLLLSKQDIINQAQQCGDKNFIHNNEPQALQTRFRGLIASGSAVSAVFSAMLPTHFSKSHDVLGLEMSFQFKGPILANTQYTMTWIIEDISGGIENSGQTLSLSGSITNEINVTQVVAKAKILLLESL